MPACPCPTEYSIQNHHIAQDCAVGFWYANWIWVVGEEHDAKAHVKNHHGEVENEDGAVKRFHATK